MGFGSLLGRRLPWPLLAAWRAARASVFRAAGGVLGPIVRRPFDPSRAARILVIRDDRIGDALLATPFLACLRRAFPASRVTVLGSDANAAALCRLPEVDEVVIGWAEMRRARPFDLAIDLHAWAHIRSAIVALLSGAPQRTGHDTHGRGLLFTVPVPFDPAIRYEPERSLDLLRHLGLPAAVEPLRFPVLAEDRERAQALLAAAGSGAAEGAGLVAIHPGSGERYAESRRLAPWKLARVADALAESWGFRVLITGGAGEESLARQVASRMKAPAIVTAGRANLGTTAALLARSTFAIAGDTGILHLARAAGTPVVALLGPKGDVNAPERLLPAGAGDHVIVRHDVGCTGCNLLRCRTYACMRALDPGEILEGCRAMIERLGRRRRERAA